VSTFLSSLVSIANAPFSVALLTVAFYVLLQGFGLLSWGEHGGHDSSNVDGHNEAIADHGNSADHGACASSGQVCEYESLSVVFWGFLGLGRVPFAVVWQSFLTMFGLVGIFITTLVWTFTDKLSSYYLLFSLPAAVIGGSIFSSGLVRLVARLMPASSGEASRRRDLIGCTGVVISSQISADFGEIRLNDPHGRVLRLICRTLPTEAPIPEGANVMVVDYQEKKDILYVCPMKSLLEENRL
jgi:membrane protein implicated in regulation of membrane protease activity